MPSCQLPPSDDGMLVPFGPLHSAVQMSAHGPPHGGGDIWAARISEGSSHSTH